MRTVTANGREIILGKRGENVSTRVVFPFAKAWEELFGAGTFELIHQRHGDAAPYPCVVTVDGPNVVWVIEDTDLAKPGAGKCEISYVVDELIAKTITYTTRVYESLSEAGPAPEPYESWVEQVLEAGAAATESAEAAANSAEAAAGSADDADADADRAEAARDEIEDMTVSARTLPAGSSATVEKSGGHGSPFSLNFGIPKGDKGDRGDAYFPIVYINPADGELYYTYADEQGPFAFEIDRATGILEVTYS